MERLRRAMTRSHPNVTALFDAGEHENRIYLIFEFVKGRSLRAEMGGRPMNVRRAVELAIQIADVVSDGHGAGFGRGRLSPDSIIVTAKGRAKVPAFELAAREGFTEIDGRLRLPDYNSPEEARCEEGDERSDVYSVGAILFEMLTTRRPLHKGAAAPSATNPRVPRELDDTVLKAISPNPDRRQPSAVLLAADLRAIVARLDAPGHSDQEEEATSARSVHVGHVMAVTGAILCLVAAIVWLITQSG